MNESDPERLRQTRARLVVKGPRPTFGQRMRLAAMRARDAAVAAGRWASRNAYPKPPQVHVHVHQPGAAEAPPSASRTYPTDGGLTPNQRLETIAGDVAGERDYVPPTIVPNYTPWYRTPDGQAYLQKHAADEERAKDDDLRRQELVEQHRAKVRLREKVEQYAREREQRAQAPQPAAPPPESEPAAKPPEEAPRERPEQDTLERREEPRVEQPVQLSPGEPGPIVQATQPAVPSEADAKSHDAPRPERPDRGISERQEEHRVEETLRPLPAGPEHRAHEPTPAGPAEAAAKPLDQPPREGLDQDIRERREERSAEETAKPSPAERFGRKQYGKKPETPEHTPPKKGPTPRR
jgi:hypothetical protein